MIHQTAFYKRVCGAVGVGALCILLAAVAAADETHSGDDGHDTDYILGSPAEADPAWRVSRGGRIYDHWMATADKPEPEGTHPAWPASNTQRSGSTTWRCKSCHGWDYKGRDGRYGSGSYRTGIPGIETMVGQRLETIVAKIRGEPHGFTPEMISDDDVLNAAHFLSSGLHDTDGWIDPESGAVRGDAGNGRAIFQTVCAACHGFDGRALNFNSDEEPAYVGTEANANPWEVLHKIRNGNPGTDMISLRAFPVQVAADVLAYIRTLPKN